MNTAIATSREIKNKETGLDITVPEYEEVSGRLTSHEEYHVIIISNLAYFRTVRTRAAEAVQFMVVKRYADFEQLHKALSDRFPATLFPELPRKVLMVKGSTPKERRQCFDNLMRFIAASTKVCCSSIVLNFLGVKAERIQQVEEGTDEEEKEDDDAFDGSKSAPSRSPQRRSKVSSSGSQQSSLFSEDLDDEMDFFKTDTTASREENGGDEEEEEREEEEEGDLFSTSSISSPSRKTAVKKDSGMLLFSENVGDMTDTDNVAGIYLPPGAKTDEGSTSTFRAEVDDEDLLNLEDDLDQLLSDVIKGPDKGKPVPRGPDKSGQTERPTPATRSVAPGKVPPRPAPRKGKAPGVTGRNDTEKLADSTTTTATAAAMDDGDILKYIQDNAADSEASLDLF